MSKTEKKAAEAKKENPTAKAEEVESNHNGEGAAKPVATAQVRDAVDYNPQKRKDAKEKK